LQMLVHAVRTLVEVTAHNVRTRPVPETHADFIFRATSSSPAGPTTASSASPPPQIGLLVILMMKKTKMMRWADRRRYGVVVAFLVRCALVSCVCRRTQIVLGSVCACVSAVCRRLAGDASASI
jgi:hypothetical protein